MRLSRFYLQNIALVAVLIAGQYASAANTCLAKPFGTVKHNLCDTPDCTSTPGFFAPPVEITAIRRGFYFESRGMQVNSGGSGWIGVDITSHELIIADRYAGRLLARAPTIANPTQSDFSRPMQFEDRHWIDVVHRRTLTPAEMDDLVCEANTLWRAERPDPTVPFQLGVADELNHLYLMDGKDVKEFDGFITAGKDGHALQQKLQALRDGFLPIQGR